MFSVAVDGALTVVTGSPDAAGGDFPLAVAFSDGSAGDGLLIATANTDAKTVSVFGVD